MSILLNTMTSMLDVMDKDVQQDISRQLFERFGESLTIPTKKKAAGCVLDLAAALHVNTYLI